MLSSLTEPGHAVGNPSPALFIPEAVPSRVVGGDCCNAASPTSDNLGLHGPRRDSAREYCVLRDSAIR